MTVTQKEKIWLTMAHLHLVQQGLLKLIFLLGLVSHLEKRFCAPSSQLKYGQSVVKPNF
jgi:predicted lipid-binding transport protein (Tim44 family)